MSTATRWGALLELGLRENLWGRRTIGLGLLVVAPAALALAMDQLAPGLDVQGELVPVIFVVGVGLVVPLLALIVGAGTLRDELREGTIVHLATRPVRRETILVTRVIAAAAAVALLGALSLTLVVPVIGSEALDAWQLGLGVTVLASIAYTGLFALLGVATRRAVLLGVVFIVGWEGAVASSPLVFRNLTVAYWLRSIVANQELPATEVVAESIGSTAASTGVSIAVLLGVGLVAGLLGALWFARRELPGPEPET